MLAKSLWIILVAAWLAGCATGGGRYDARPSAQDKLSYPSVSPDANAVLPLSSNKDGTRFTVDGKPVGTVNAGGELKILVNNQPHNLVAEAPGYRRKESLIQPPYDGVSTVSFHYTYKDETSESAPTAVAVIEDAPVSVKPSANHSPLARPVPPSAQTPSPPPVASLEPLPVPSNPASFGRFIALLIGNDKYQYGKPLDSAVADVQSIEVILKSKFGFQVTVLTNATRRDILGALENLKNSVDENTNVLIYYAGHGHEEKAETRGYWLPVDAEENNSDKWIANDDITSKLKAMPARHVLVIADSCYSGSISRGDAFRGARRTEPGGPDSTGYLQKVAMKKSRQVLTSGGEEPVMDGGGKNGHSVFASALLDALQDGTGALDGHLLVEKIRKTISYNAEQNPEFNYIPSSGHDGGEFLFIPRD